MHHSIWKYWAPEVLGNNGSQVSTLLFHIACGCWDSRKRGKESSSINWSWEVTGLHELTANLPFRRIRERNQYKEQSPDKIIKVQILERLSGRSPEQVMSEVMDFSVT